MRTWLPGLVFGFVLVLGSVSAQVQAGDSLTDNAVLRFNLLGIPAVGFEKKLTPSFTIRAEWGLGFPLIIKKKQDNGISKLSMESGVNPYLVLESRYYYNLSKHPLGGKPTQCFSGEYIGFFYRYNAYQYQQALSLFNHREGSVKEIQYLGALVWGVQRNFGRNEQFYMNWALGFGVKTNGYCYDIFSMTTQFGLGFEW